MKKTARATHGHRAVLVVAVTVLLGALRGLADAQPSLNPSLASARSHSGQFVVYARRPSLPSLPFINLATNKSFVRLEPPLVAVSCERIKQLLASELGTTAPWRGQIYVVLYPADGASDTITITSERFKGGWHYRVDLPDMVERSRYVRAVVQVLLLELANRSATERSAEIPLWLIEGFSQLLLASNEIEIILPPPRDMANGLAFTARVVNARKEGFWEQAQKKLHGRLALTFENLSWPTEDEMAGNTDDLYRGSAQLFIGELLRLPDGPACLRNMLAQLPQNYNWQFAFLGAFHACFERPLDVEKWWALSLARGTGHDLARKLSLEESWQNLDQALHSAVQVRTGADELPLHAELKLQTMIRDWEFVRQTQALQNTLRELAVLRLRIAQEFVGLLQDYSQVLESYLQRRAHPGFVLPLTRNLARQRAAEAAVQQLDALDARKEALRPIPGPAITNSPPAPTDSAQ